MNDENPTGPATTELPSADLPPADIPPRPSAPPPRRPSRWGLKLVGGAAVLAVTAAGSAAITAHQLDHGSSSVVHSGTSNQVAATTGSVATALRKITPSVVLINGTVTSGRGGGFGGPGSFGGQQAVGRIAGTGIIISSAGEVVTNAHVVNGASDIKVTLPGGKAHPATVLGMDTTKDLAVIKVSGVSGLTPATFASSSKVKVGDSVIAVGNAEGYGGAPTVTEGIVSAKNRSLTDSTDHLSGLLQTDAAINPGNSGGPLVNSNGDVIGINTAVETGSNTEPAQNIGFAIASDTVTANLPALEKGAGAPGSGGSGSTAGGAYLGVSVADSSQGATIASVVPGGPASKAGLQSGDVVTAIGGNQVAGAQELVTALRSDKAGQKVQLSIEHGGQQGSVTVTLGAAPTQQG